jgi:acyl-homoserine lactone acylase PvdQ
MKRLKYAAGVFFTLISGVAIGIYGFLQSTLPKTKGHIALEGLSARVEVIRDKWGIPHIFAQDKKGTHHQPWPDNQRCKEGAKRGSGHALELE